MTTRATRALLTGALSAAIATGTAATALAGTAPDGNRLTPHRAAATHQNRETRLGRATSTTTRYAIIKHLCDVPRNVHEASCMALQKVNVRKGTAGAVAYAAPDGVGAGPAGGYAPGELARAYGVNPDAATNQTIAIVDAYDDPYALSELNLFDETYRLPHETSATFRKVNQNGATAPLPKADAGWSGEIALDLQAVRGMCHHCRIVLVESDTPTNDNLATAVNTSVRLGAGIVSNSYGAPEAGATPAIQRAYNHPGTVILASTGDHGWYDWDFANNIGGSPDTTGASDDMPNTPAAFPTVVAVGGTELAVDASGRRQDEAVWNENGPDDVNGIFEGNANGPQGASGGGCSLRYDAPAWQRNASGYSALGCDGKRMTGDVAALADPVTGFDVYSHYSNGWVTTGGTSLASPLVAALWGLAGGARGVDYPAKTLYGNLALRPGGLYDVVEGGNAFCAGDTKTNCADTVSDETNPPTGNPNNINNGSSQHNGTVHGDGWAGLLDCGFDYSGAGQHDADHQCNAAPGFDGPSGVGAPAGLGAFVPTTPSVALAADLPAHLGRAGAFEADVTEPVADASAVGYAWSWGDGTSSTSTTALTRHAYHRAGRYQVKVVVTDSLGQQGSAAGGIVVGLAPAAHYAGPAALRHGARGAFAVAAVDPNTGGRVTRIVWTFGDGHTGTGTRVAHAFVKRGTYRVGVAVVDDSGITTRLVRSVRVV